MTLSAVSLTLIILGAAIVGVILFLVWLDPQAWR